MTAQILVIDDTQDILDLFKLLLEEDGYEVYLSSVLYEQLSDIEQPAPDVIILDLLIREDQQAGWKFLQRLKMYPATTHIPVVLCTAATRLVREQEDYLLQKGIRVLFKPFDVDDLSRMMQQVLGENF